MLFRSRAAHGDADRAVRYYAGGYYYVTKRQRHHHRHREELARANAQQPGGPLSILPQQ